MSDGSKVSRPDRLNGSPAVTNKRPYPIGPQRSGPGRWNVAFAIAQPGKQVRT